MKNLLMLLLVVVITTPLLAQDVITAEISHNGFWDDKLEVYPGEMVRIGYFSLKTNQPIRGLDLDIIGNYGHFYFPWNTDERTVIESHFDSKCRILYTDTAPVNYEGDYEAYLGYFNLACYLEPGDTAYVRIEIMASVWDQDKSQIRNFFVEKELTVYCIDWIRGDLDGDGDVDSKDQELALDNYCNFQDGSEYNISRCRTLLDIPAPIIDSWFMSDYINKKTAGDYADLVGIGEPMSTSWDRIRRMYTGISYEIVNNTIFINNYNGADIVQISGLKKDGVMWSHEVFGSDQGALQIPEDIILASIKVKAVELPTSLKTLVKSNAATVAKGFVLEQNYPNPFNPMTTIKYSVGTPSEVSVTIHNINGQIIANLASGFHVPGTYSVVFDGSNISSGLYFYTLNVDNLIMTKRMVLTK